MFSNKPEEVSEMLRGVLSHSLHMHLVSFTAGLDTSWLMAQSDVQA